MNRNSSDLLLFISSILLLLLALGLFFFETGKAQIAVAQEKGKAQPSKEEEQIKKIHKDIDKVKAELMKTQKYGCCINPGCDFCPLAAAMCPCMINAAKKQPVCPECKAGWVSGQGQIPGLKNEDIKSFTDDTLKMMMQSRAKMKEK
jgi:hypothetical protein